MNLPTLTTHISPLQTHPPTPQTHTQPPQPPLFSAGTVCYGAAHAGRIKGVTACPGGGTFDRVRDSKIMRCMPGPALPRYLLTSCQGYTTALGGCSGASPCASCACQTPRLRMLCMHAPLPHDSALRPPALPCSQRHGNAAENRVDQHDKHGWRGVALFGEAALGARGGRELTSQVLYKKRKWRPRGSSKP